MSFVTKMTKAAALGSKNRIYWFLLALFPYTPCFVNVLVAGFLEIRGCHRYKDYRLVGAVAILRQLKSNWDELRVCHKVECVHLHAFK